MIAGGGLILVSHYSSFSCFSDGEMTGRDEKRLKKAFGRTSEGGDRAPAVLK